MKILFLTPWYPDENNSFHGIFVRDQAVAAKQQHEVWLISSKIDYSKFGIFSSEVKESEFHGVKEFRIKIKKSLPIFNQLNFFLLTVWHTWQLTSSFNPDIIHGNIGYPGGFWAWCTGKILNKPFIVTEHTRIYNNFRTKIHRWLSIFSLKRASAIVSVSPWHANEIAALLSIQPVVIPNIVRFENFENIKPSLPSQRVQFGFLGSMNTDVKGLDLLLKAVSSIQQDFTLHVGGDGVLLEGYRAMAREFGITEKCIFYGRLTPEQVPSFMSRLHFFVSASRSETFGISIVEAMAAGLPVVATKSGGPQEFVCQENGILVLKESAEELRSGIERMLDQYKTYSPEAIRKFVKDRYSANAFLSRICNVYNSVASGESNR